MRQPGDGVRLAAAGRVLDEVGLPRAVFAGVGDELAHAVKLVVAGEDQEAPAGLAAVLVFFLHLVDEVADEVKHAVGAHVSSQR